jgi:hypothetical protein
VKSDAERAAITSTTQGAVFAYISTILDPYSRFTPMAGSSYGAFRSPIHPGWHKFHGIRHSNFNSALLNENQVSKPTHAAAWQRSINGQIFCCLFQPLQFSAFHSRPDRRHIIFNGVASQVFRLILPTA